jgi:putative hydrolase of the HAD superfamily
VLRDDPEGKEAFAAVEMGEISQRDYEIVLGRLLGVDDHGLLTRALGGLRPRPEVLDFIRRARAADIRVGLLSNSWGEGEFDPYAGYDLDDIFDAVVISGDTGLRKPDPAIYLIAADQLGVPPSECVYADDTGSNLPPAEELGMATVHFTDAAKGISEISRLLGLPDKTRLSRTGSCFTRPSPLTRAARPAPRRWSPRSLAPAPRDATQLAGDQ